MKQHINSIISIAAAGLAMLVLSGSSLLTNGSFESGNLSGWTDPSAGGGAGSVGAPSVGAQDGTSAALLTEEGGVGELRQAFAASPGDEFNFSGYMLTEAALPAGPSFGLYKIVFRDVDGNDLEPASVSVGQAGPAENPGVESLPFLNDASAVDTWVFSEAQGVAPAGTTEVLFLALNVDFAGGENPIWFDNIVATNVATSASLLSNGSFETGDLTGWEDGSLGGGGAASVGAPGVGAQNGTSAALLTQEGGVGELRQIFTASPGDEFNLSGYLLSEAALPVGASFGLYKIVFKDIDGNDLEPASISVGQAGPVENPGVESLPFLNDASPVDTWVFSEAQGVAPAGTTQVLFLALNVDFAGGENPIWFDNIVATNVATSESLLANGSFETGDLTGWLDPSAVGGGSATIGAPGVGAQDGSFAALLTQGGGVGELRQVFPASAGEEFNMNGYMLTEAALPAGPSFGLFKIVFQDGNGDDLEPASISIGQAGPVANPGVESLPFLNDASPVNTWVFSEAQGVAPEGTTQVLFLALNVDFAGGVNPIWFDNIEASQIGGEPGVVLGESLTVAPGIINSGGLPELEESDNTSLVLFRDSTSTAAVTQFVLTATSPTTTPTTFEFVLEGRCVSRPNVVQRVEFFNYVTGAFETVDEQNAARTPPDLSITVTPTGDLSRFVNQSTGEIQTRVRYRADSPRASFSSRTDQAIWMIQ